MFTLTPQGRSVAAVVLAFTLLTGSLNRAVYAVLGLLDLDLIGRGELTIATVLMLALAVAVLLYARGAAGQEGWGAPLAQGATVLALVGVAIAAIQLLAVLIQGDSSALLPGFHVFDAVD